MDGIPPAAKTDAEDVVWALQTADALWKRHERVDAIVWLRRAAQAAAESQNDDRALTLARSAAELSEWIARNPAPGRSSAHDFKPEEDSGASVFEDEVITNARTLAAISGEVLVPAELRSATVTQERAIPKERLELPKRVPPGIGLEAARRARPRPSRPGSSSDLKASLSPRKAVPPPLPPRRAPPPPSPPLPPRMRPESSGRTEHAAPTSSGRPPQSTMNVEEEELLPSMNFSLIEEDEQAIEGKEASEEAAEPQSAERVPERRASVDEEETIAPIDASAFDSVTQKIKADLRALDASTRRTATDETETPSPGSTTPAPPSPRPEREAVPPPPDLSSLEAFADLPDDARDAFATTAKVFALNGDEEVSGFALAAVLEGEIDVCATIVDAAGERLQAGAVLRAAGSIGIGTPLRFVCASEQARVATWNAEAVAEAFRTCPWVEEDLCAAANRTHAVVGATMGPLGERLDAAIRKQITDRLDVRALEPGDILVQKGQPVPGIVLVGVGSLEVVQGEAVSERVSAGQFLFSTSILGGGAAPGTARASSEGAIILFADRMVAHELLLTCPPLLEVLAGM